MMSLQVFKKKIIKKGVAKNSQTYLLNTSYYTRIYVYIMLSISYVVLNTLNCIYLLTMKIFYIICDVFSSGKVGLKCSASSKFI